MRLGIYSLIAHFSDVTIQIVTCFYNNCCLQWRKPHGLKSGGTPVKGSGVRKSSSRVLQTRSPGRGLRTKSPEAETILCFRSPNFKLVLGFPL